MHIIKKIRYKLLKYHIFKQLSFHHISHKWIKIVLLFIIKVNLLQMGRSTSLDGSELQVDNTFFGILSYDSFFC